MQINVAHLWIIPVVTVLVQMLRSIPKLEPVPWLIPWLAIVVGLVVAGLAALFQPIEATSVTQALGAWGLTGIIAGLAGAGLYSAVGKKVVSLLGK